MTENWFTDQLIGLVGLGARLYLAKHISILSTSIYLAFTVIYTEF